MTREPGSRGSLQNAALRCRVLQVTPAVLLSGMLIWPSMAASSGEPATGPRVSFDAIVSRHAPTVRGLQWRDSRHLLAEFSENGSNRAVARTISLDGRLSEPIGEGRYPSVSPDGQLLLQYPVDGWTIRELAGEKTLRIASGHGGHRNCAPRSRPAWSVNGRYAAFIECFGRVASEKPLTLEPDTGVRVMNVADRRPALEPGSRIVIFDRTNPGEPQRILLDEFALEMAWGPDATLYVSVSELITGDASTKLVEIEPGASTVETVYHTPGRFQGMRPAVHPDGRAIALVLDADHRVWDDFQSLILVDAGTGRELRRLTHGLPLVGADYFWSRTGEEIYARVRNGGLDQIYAIPLDGEPRPLTGGERRHYAMQLSPDGRRLAYRTEDGYGREDIRVLDLETAEERILLVTDEPAEEFDLGTWRHIRWDSTDGIRPFGFLFLPPDFDAGQRYPMLVDVHGGGPGSRLYLDAPFSIAVAPGPLEWHAWAALGFVVFVPDYRSSGDYGPKTIGARYRSGVLAATQDIDDIVSGTQHVVQQGFVDPSRVSILGHSAGGRRVFLLLTQYSLYAAAILNEPIAPGPASLVMRMLSGDNTGSYPAGMFRQTFGGELDEYADRYKINYLFDSHRITTPTLIMAGNEELGGVRHMPLEVTYSILRHYATPAKMLEFVDEGHTYSRPETAAYAFEQARRWIEAHTGTR